MAVSIDCSRVSSFALSLNNVNENGFRPTSGPVSTGMDDRVRVQFSVPDIYLGM